MACQSHQNPFNGLIADGDCSCSALDRCSGGEDFGEGWQDGLWSPRGRCGDISPLLCGTVTLSATGCTPGDRRQWDRAMEATVVGASSSPPVSSVRGARCSTARGPADTCQCVLAKEPGIPSYWWDTCPPPDSGSSDFVIFFIFSEMRMLCHTTGNESGCHVSDFDDFPIFLKI